MALTALVWLTVLAIPATAQLTAEDIEALQQRAIEEGWTFKIGWTPACERTPEELCGFDPTLAPDDETELWDPIATGTRDLPARFDWRDSTELPIAKNQGGCGSCWAFATVGPLECLIKLKSDITVNLSEQWIVSCNPYGYDCEGGFTVPQMFRTTGDPCGGNGAVMESEFPYIEANGTCNCPYEHFYWIESYANVSNDIPSLKQAIYEYGPIMVSVYADEDVWPSYNGGVFNACAGNPTNHAVTLVGWDDNQGTQGVWLLRNSWGHAWGEEGGYMRIPYYCSSVGNNAKRIYYQPVIVTATPTLGAYPLSVTFTANTPRDSIVECGWLFGDGDWAFGDTVVHTYTETGVFDIEVELSTPHGTINKDYDQMILVHADTARVPNIVGTAGTTVKCDVYLRNTFALEQIILPFTWDGPMNLTHDSISVVGCRTGYFNKTYLNYSAYYKRAAIRLYCPSGQPWLGVGAGAVVSLYFTIPGGATGVNPIQVYSYGSYSPTLVCDAGPYPPALVAGSIEVPSGCCQGNRGNTDGSIEDNPTLGDLTVMIDHLFISLDPIDCWEEANVDESQPEGAGSVTLGDLTVMIDNLFISLAPMPPCP